MNSLPAGVQQPFILKFDLSNIPVCLVTLSGGGLDEKQLYDLAYNTVEPQIERLAGVASANVDGGKIRQITVNLNRDLLYSKGISVTEVARAVNDSNFLLPSGDVKLGSLDYNVFTNNQFSVVDPMENIVVRRLNGTPIRVRDIGRVEDSAETQQSDRPRQRRAAPCTSASTSSRAPIPSRSWTPSSARCPSCSACRRA